MPDSDDKSSFTWILELMESALAAPAANRNAKTETSFDRKVILAVYRPISPGPLEVRSSGIRDLSRVP
jgi:hypothetical protein